MKDSIHAVFDSLKMQSVTSETLDSALAETGNKILFLWGYNCPNCEVSKQSLYEHAEEVTKLPLRWFHCNVYENFDIATRFGLHGIPVFFLYKDSKVLGKITSYPGFEPFIEVLNKAFK